TILTMGLPRAAEVIREAIFRGADTGIVLTDRALGGADTLATSYSLAQAIKKMGKVDIVLCGRQAIDGDTAQVGPQIAEKLGLPQVTYAEEILSTEGGKAVIRRRIEHGVETVKAPMPLVVTVNGSAPDCRPRNARRVMQFKYAVSPSEKAKLSEELQTLVDKRPGLNLQEWSAAFVEADPEQIGMPGSPTKVKAIENVVFTAKESLRLEDNDEQIENLVKTLIANHTIG
ncbi:MAG: electron transfer flavoprotein subunit beta/FixA family protein, partial [Muribaculaceae bacterium]|nr:electron transfer flavoprotein subunit beta/FixA family protein [Muribaculaceae bacterium]